MGVILRDVAGGKGTGDLGLTSLLIRRRANQCFFYRQKVRCTKTN